MLDEVVDPQTVFLHILKRSVQRLTILTFGFVGQSAGGDVSGWSCEHLTEEIGVSLNRMVADPDWQVK